MTWRRAALLALAVALPAHAFALEFKSHRVVLAPADATASLAVEHDPSSRTWRVEASHDEVLVVQSATAKVAVPDVDLAGRSSIQVTWVPSMGPSALMAPHIPPPLARSTFERLFGAASPSALPFLFSTGVHVSVAVASAGVESHTVARGLLAALAQNASAPLRSLLQEMRGDEASQVLARSLCASTGFTRHQTPDQKACFSASFELTEAVWPLLSGEWAPAFASVAGARPTLTAVTLRASAHDPSLLTVELVSAFVTLSSELDSSALAPPLGSQHRVVAVKAIDGGNSVASVVSFSDESETSQGLPPAAAVVDAAISVSVAGEGFHRRARVELASDRLCAADEVGAARVLLVVPLSTSIYADLDELRRMERFGELKLHSPTKHIEIERPMAVSTQHAVALEFGIDRSQHLHALEFPIHLRYQSPSNSTMYASATLMAPEVFVSCGTTPDTDPVVLDGPLQHVFTRTRGKDEWEAMSWHRVVPPSPVYPVFITVPVGYTPHGTLVSAVTLSVTGLGALVLVYVALTAPKRTRETPSAWKPKTV